jgi:signal transduction histidine kinase
LDAVAQIPLGVPAPSCYGRAVSPKDSAESLAQRRFGQKVVSLVIAGFLAVLLAGLASGLVMVRTQEFSRWVSHTYEVERHVANIRLAFEQLRSARRAVLLKISNASGISYTQARKRLFLEIDQVARLTIDNPRQQSNVRHLRQLTGELDRRFVASFDANVAGVNEDERGRQEAAAEVQALADRMLEEERQLLIERQASQRSAVESFYVVLGVAAVLLVVVGFGSVLVIRRYTTDLAGSRDQLRRLNADLETLVSERTRELQRANDEIQRFAYIVSHDLRAPLVNVMGFTAEMEASVKPLAALVEQVEREAPQLASSEATVAVREDLPESLGFIRASTQKMDRLINAILRLSREGRRAIAPERIDLNLLVRNVVDAIHHVLADRGATVEVAPGLPTVVTDRLSLEQILSNLIENAAKFLRPGVPGLIRINSVTRQGRVEVSVTDNGRGIDPRDHDRVFDLFRRSGEQDQPGEGIGLAHVRAQAYRLGGTIQLSSALGEGATFTINLPAVFAGTAEGQE